FLHHEHLAGIAVKVILDDSDVDVDDVALLQNLGVAGDAVADHVIDGSADGLGETVVVQGGGNCLLHVDYIVMTNAVQFSSGDARAHVRSDHFQHLGGQAAGDTHLFDFVGCLDNDGHGVGCRLLYWSLILVFVAGRGRVPSAAGGYCNAASGRMTGRAHTAVLYVRGGLWYKAARFAGACPRQSVRAVQRQV